MVINGITSFFLLKKSKSIERRHRGKKSRVQYINLRLPDFENEAEIPETHFM
jgi:hypothetical protein